METFMSDNHKQTQISNTKVDLTQVSTPEVNISDKALSQLRLILENDFTLKGKYLRLLISGKGCDGFSYSVGFTDWNDDDMMIKVKGSETTPSEMAQDDSELQIIMDPFTAFYLQKCSVDYVEDFANNNEGFVVVNENQRSFSGKFWKQDEQKVPPTLKS